MKHCHPPKSVHVVERIVEDFKAGRQSVAEFWIDLHGKFVHIRYFAVRDSAGAYLGTLEVTQALDERKPPQVPPSRAGPKGSAVSELSVARALR